MTASVNSTQHTTIRGLPLKARDVVIITTEISGESGWFMGCTPKFSALALFPKDFVRILRRELYVLSFSCSCYAHH